MGKAPAYLMYAQDFDMDTASWSNEEVGVYQRLLNYSWVNRGLPSDTVELSRIVREKRSKFEKIFSKNISKKWSENGNGKLINKKQEEVRQNQLQFIESQREKGKKSAEKRWAGHITPVTTTVTERLQPKDNSSSSSSIKKKKIKDSSSSCNDTKIFLSFYKEKFTDCFGTEPQIEWGKDGSITSKLLKSIPLDELKSLLEAFLVSDDKFIQGSGYTLGVFKTQINKLKIGQPSSHRGLQKWANEIMEEEHGREG